MLPNVPTTAEAGLPVEIAGWFGFMVPAGTPKDVVDKIYTDVNTVLKDPEMLSKLAAQGMTPVANTPDQFGKQINYALNDAFTTTTEEAHAAGIQGPGRRDGTFNGGQDWAGWLGAGMSVLNGAMSANERDKGQKDNRAWGETGGAVVGAIIAGAFSFGAAPRIMR